MIRKIIEIDEEKCDGCGLCVNACHEGAIGLVNGKARLLRDDYCDGLGDCLPACPAGAITFVEREALAYDEAAVQVNMQLKKSLGCACPGTAARSMVPLMDNETAKKTNSEMDNEQASAQDATPRFSQLRQWPVQIKLVPVTASFFNGADLLLAADCTAFASADFHSRFMRGKVTLIGCPKLDNADYSEKLSEILRHNDIRSITVARMSVPCCAGIAFAAVNALKKSEKDIPLRIFTLTPEGEILPQEEKPGLGNRFSGPETRI